MRLFARSSIATITVALTASVGIHAGAHEPIKATECSADDVEVGECLTVISSSDGSDPIRSAVEQALLRGETSQAERFVESRRDAGHSDADQAAIEGLVEDFKAGDFDGPDFAPLDTGDGTVSGYLHTLEDEPSYALCAPSGCTTVGKFRLRLYYNIFNYPQNTLNGSLSVTQGTNIAWTNVQCRTRYDRSASPDTTVRTWPNCENAESSSFRGSAAILSSTWTQGGTIGAKYHNDYSVTFTTPYGQTYGPITYTTDRYYISGSVDPYWL
jgi:hypothetical protein